MLGRGEKKKKKKKRKEEEAPLNVTFSEICILERGLRPLFLKQDRWCCDSNAADSRNSTVRLSTPRSFGKLQACNFHARICAVCREKEEWSRDRISFVALRAGEKRSLAAETAVSITRGLIMRNHARDRHARG